MGPVGFGKVRSSSADLRSGDLWRSGGYENGGLGSIPSFLAIPPSQTGYYWIGFPSPTSQFPHKRRTLRVFWSARYWVIRNRTETRNVKRDRTRNHWDRMMLGRIMAGQNHWTPVTVPTAGRAGSKRTSVHRPVFTSDFDFVSVQVSVRTDAWHGA